LLQKIGAFFERAVDRLVHRVIGSLRNGKLIQRLDLNLDSGRCSHGSGQVSASDFLGAQHGLQIVFRLRRSASCF